MHLVSFLRGMAFGGILVYLFAPRSGAETRQMLAQKGNDLKSLLTDDFLTITDEASNQPVHHTIEATESKSGNIYDPATLKDL